MMLVSFFWHHVNCCLLIISPQFEGAYNILTDAEESGEISTISLYNAIMLGYYREVNSWASVSSQSRHYIFIHVIESAGALHWTIDSLFVQLQLISMLSLFSS
jgi:hypothetical protein